MVGKNSLNGKNVTLTGDYTLALADDVAQSATKVDGKFTALKKGTATFRTSSYSNEFYTLDGKKIIYTAKGGYEIKIDGLKPNVTMSELQNSVKISEDGGTLKITFVTRDALNGKAPTISTPKGITYTVAVDDSIKVAAPTLGWTVNGINATLSTDIAATYNVAKNKVKYKPKKSGKPQLVLAGLVKNSTLATPEGKVVTLDTEILGVKTSVKSNTGGYSFKLTGDMAGKIFTGTGGADTITVAAENATVQGGKGNDDLTPTKGTTLIYGAGDGNDSICFAEGLTVSLSGSTKLNSLSKNDSNIVLCFGKNSSITVADFGESATFQVVGKKQNLTVDTSKFAVAEKLTFDKTKSPTAVTIAADFTGSISQADDLYLGGGKLSNVTTFDGRNIGGKISIEGNAKANKIYGGASDDTLIGGKSNDSLWGSDGADTFIYANGDGNDIIYGFADDDLLQISGAFSGTYNSSKKELSLTVGKTKNAIILRDFTAASFNINGTAYTLTDGKLK